VTEPWRYECPGEDCRSVDLRPRADGTLRCNRCRRTMERSECVDKKRRDDGPGRRGWRERL
jgi:hypothetical protein